MRISDWSSDVCSSDLYSGWALFGFVLVSAITANLVLTVMLQGRGVHFSLACAAFLLVTTTLVVFFTAAYPANQETQNWTVMANDWRLLRKQWEYSHAINAVLTFLALCALTLAAVLPHRPPRARSEARRVGKACVSPCRARGSPDH